jgi:hypothetical protein
MDISTEELTSIRSTSVGVCIIRSWVHAHLSSIVSCQEVFEHIACNYPVEFVSTIQTGEGCIIILIKNIFPLT